MKALIVDDEKHVRDAVKMIVEWKRFGFTDIFEAEDGEEAIRMALQERPELIVTDMRMPRADGSKLLEWISHHCPESKVIVVSGHDDFEYVRSTVKYGGIDYILKPIDVDQLNDAVQKAVDSLREEERNRFWEERRNLELNRFRPVYWEKLYSSLLMPEAHTHSTFAELRKEFRLTPDLNRCRIGVLTLDILAPKVKRAFREHTGLLFFALSNIGNELLNRRHAGFVFRNWNEQNELVILLWRDIERGEAMLREINDGFYFSLKGRFDIGLGESVPFPQGMIESYRQARAALDQRSLLTSHGTHGRIHIYHEQIETAHSLYFSDFEDRFRTAIHSSHPTKIADAVSAWVEAVGQLPDVTYGHLKRWRREYELFKHRWLEEEIGMAEHQRPSSSNLDWDVPIDDDGVLDLKQWGNELNRVLQQMAALLQNRDNPYDIVQEICTYIQKNIHEPLSLKTIAERFYLSREYISRKFKQERGENLTDFITRCRMEKARMLLMNPRLKIAHISQLVGYQDEKYFSKVFKKTTGMSPQQYRIQTRTPLS